MVASYLLVEGDHVYLIDSGFIGGLAQIERALDELGFGWENVKAVLMTHGHLDHTYNLARIVEKSGAEVFAHVADVDHFAGTYPYAGISRICGGLEKAGRTLFDFKPVMPDHHFEDGEVLDFWGGLEVIHLPGHTKGHCGFYSREKKLLFSGDLFECRKIRTALPWSFLNSCPEFLPASLEKVLKISLEGILSNHCDRLEPAEQWARFRSRFRG